jgi:hypothetical protein
MSSIIGRADDPLDDDGVDWADSRRFAGWAARDRPTLMRPISSSAVNHEWAGDWPHFSTIPRASW